MQCHLTFIIDKRNKVKLMQIIFAGNDNVSDYKTEKTNEGHKGNEPVNTLSL